MTSPYSAASLTVAGLAASGPASPPWETLLDALRASRATAADLDQLATAAFGEAWPHPFARFAQVNVRTCQRVKRAADDGAADPAAGGLMLAYLTALFAQAAGVVAAGARAATAAKWRAFNKPVAALGLGRRAMVVARNEGWAYVGQVATVPAEAFGLIPDCGAATVAEIRAALTRIGLDIGEDAADWLPPPGPLTRLTD